MGICAALSAWVEARRRASTPVRAPRCMAESEAQALILRVTGDNKLPVQPEMRDDCNLAALLPDQADWKYSGDSPPEDSILDLETSMYLYRRIGGVCRPLSFPHIGNRFRFVRARGRGEAARAHEILMLLYAGSSILQFVFSSCTLANRIKFVVRVLEMLVDFRCYL